MRQRLPSLSHCRSVEKPAASPAGGAVGGVMTLAIVRPGSSTHVILQADAVADADGARVGYPRVSAPSEEPATVRFAFDHDRPRKESFG